MLLLVCSEQLSPLAFRSPHTEEGRQSIRGNTEESREHKELNALAIDKIFSYRTDKRRQHNCGNNETAMQFKGVIVHHST